MLKRFAFRTGVVAATVGIAATAFTGFASADASGPPVCHNIGNGLLCIKIDARDAHPYEVTVWYDKRSGDDVWIDHLEYQVNGAIVDTDNGQGFWARAGHIYGYDWSYATWESAGCYAPVMIVANSRITGNADCV